MVYVLPLFPELPEPVLPLLPVFPELPEFPLLALIQEFSALVYCGHRSPVASAAMVPFSLDG